MRLLTFASIALLAATASTAQVKKPFKPMTQAELDTALNMGDAMEATAVGDLNGDNDVDTVFIVSSPADRNLYVALASRKPAPLRHVPAGSFKLQQGNISPAQLSIHNGVLTVDDRIDGMTSVYRFRGETAQAKMRLIGLDTALFPDGGRDGNEMSWNLLNGDMVTSVLRANSKKGFDKLYTQKEKRTSKPVYMENTPDPEMVLISETKAK